MKEIFLKGLSMFLAITLVAVQTNSLSAKTLNTGIPSIEEAAFILDQNALDSAFSDLDKLDNYLSMNEGVTYEDLRVACSNLIAGVSNISAPLGQIEENEEHLGIPAFWYGCLLGIVGVILVYILTDSDKAETKKAVNGLLVTLGSTVVISLILVAIITIIGVSEYDYAY